MRWTRFRLATLENYSRDHRRQIRILFLHLLQLLLPSAHLFSYSVPTVIRGLRRFLNPRLRFVIANRERVTFLRLLTSQLLKPRQTSRDLSLHLPSNSTDARLLLRQGAPRPDSAESVSGILSGFDVL